MVNILELNYIQSSTLVYIVIQILLILADRIFYSNVFYWWLYERWIEITWIESDLSLSVHYYYVYILYRVVFLR